MLAGNIPVSYTHLDVYKRQEQGGKTVLKRHPEDVELYQVKDGKKLRDIDVPADLKPLVIDVYKRQVAA